MIEISMDVRQPVDRIPGTSQKKLIGLTKLHQPALVWAQHAIKENAAKGKASHNQVDGSSFGWDG